MNQKIRSTQIEDSKPTSSDVSPAVRLTLQGLGFVSLGLGFAGAFLPLLPTTPFVLLSGWCFAKSSPRWNAYLRRHREFGPLIHNWKNNRSIARRHKIVAVTMIVISVTGAWLSDRPLGFKIGLSVGLSVILTFLLLTKTTPRS